jgi:serine protease
MEMALKRPILWLILILLTAAAASTEEMFIQNTILIKLKKNALSKTNSANPGSFLGIPSVDRKLTMAGASHIENRFKLSIQEEDFFGLSRIFKITFPEGVSLQEIINELNKEPDVEYAERIPLNFRERIPNDSLYSEQQHLPQIRAEEAWNIHKGEDGPPVVIGVVDDAIDWRHPDLVQNVWQNLGEDANHNGEVLVEINGKVEFDPGDINHLDDDGNGYVDDFVGWDFYNASFGQDNDPAPETESADHGTHVAGLAAGVTNNRTGISSISWNVKFISCKHDNDGENPIGGDLYQGILYVVDQNADVVNMSWGGTTVSQANQDVIDYAWSKGSILVSAAGNDNWELLHYPSNYSHVISVAAVSSDDRKASYSNYGLSVDICAPGGEYWVDQAILSTIPGGKYARFQGTSMATPIVSGLLALIKSYNPAWNKEQIITQLIATSDSIDDENPERFHDKLGYGRIDAYRALSETNVDFPQTLRLDIDRLPPNDTNNNQALERGEKAYLGFRIRNFNPLIGDDNARFILTSMDPDIEILNGSYTAEIPIDETVTLTNIFQIQISPDIHSHVASLKMRIEADRPILGGNETEIKLLIGAGGVLIWEPVSESPNSSGTYIYQFLQNQNIDAVYINDFPHALTGFDAVFLCFGTVNDLSPEFDNQKAQAIRTFLVQGGKLYFEGVPNAPDFETQFTSLQSLLGLSSVTLETKDILLKSLTGARNTLADGLQFNGSTQADQRIMTPLPRNGAEILFRETSHGSAAVIYEGASNQRVITMTYALSQLKDGNLPSTRAFLLTGILDFFDLLPDQIFVCDFSTDEQSGNQPFLSQFHDLSFSIPSKPVTEWHWDINNNGHFESSDSTLNWTYGRPGIYNVSLTSGNGTLSQTITKPGLVQIFDGTSALFFNGGTSLVRIDPSDSLNVKETWTLEAWIYPQNFGEVRDMGYGRIIDKEAISIFLHNNEGIYNGQSLVLAIDGPNGRFSAFSSTSGSISLDQWSHIAVCFDQGGREVTMYINGFTQTVSAFYDTLETVADHLNQPLYIGNRADRDRAFEGKMDEIRLWKRIRSADEIQNNMQKTISPQRGLIGYWKFDEGSGSTILDETGMHPGSGELIAYVPNTPFQFISEAGLQENLKPMQTLLGYNYPNPFNPVTTIPYVLPEKSRVTLTVYNILGEEVVTLIQQSQNAGSYQVRWDGRDTFSRPVAAGLYFCRLVIQTGETDRKVQTRKMVLIR